MAASQPPLTLQQRYRRNGWRVFMVVGGLVMLSIGLLVYLALDDAPVDDADLRLTLTPAPDDQNGMRVLDALYLVFEEMDESDAPNISDLLEPEDGSAPDWEAIRARLAEVEPHLAKADEALAAPHFHGPWPLRPDSTMPGINASIALANFLTAKARLQLHDGDPEAAWQTLTKVLELAERLEDCKSALIAYLVAQACKSIAAMEPIGENLSAFAPDRATARQRTDQLAHYRSTDEDLRNALRGEYMWFVSVQEMMQDHAKREPNLAMPYLYKPNRTQAYVANYHREMHDNIGRPDAQVAFPYGEELTRQMYGPIRLDMVDNVIGKTVIALGLSGIGDVVKKSNRFNAQLELLRLGLALTAYANGHGGALPATLEALAPDYIDAIPVDPITHEPFQYDPAKRKVWSIGPDLKDDGGLPIGERNHREPHDIVVEIPDGGNSPG